MWACVGLLFAAGLSGQTLAPIGIIRGTVLEWDSLGRTGDLSLRASDNHVYIFAFDSRTYFEADNQRIAISGLKTGDTVEILSDRAAAPGKRYARTVRLIPRAPAVHRFPQYRTRYRVKRTSPLLDDELFPRGNLTFSGIVSSVTGDRLILRLYRQGEKKIALRDDTRYVQNGLQVPASALKVNARIFIRAGESIDGELEAYSVMWGEILRPRPK